MFTKSPRERGELCDVFKAIEEALWDARKPHLRADERSGENAAGLILSAAVKGVEHAPFRSRRESAPPDNRRSEAGGRSRRAFHKQSRLSRQARF